MKCARCEADVPGQAREVDVHQGTGASPTLVVHDRPEDCAPVTSVRRHN